jgi:alkanesulfonate monooxygenase SsuD/methylene tetrahydromethanopterin reductase-like flavin-dependent oxidoreductase (luciferase family)
VKGRLARYGREAESLAILPGIMPFVGRTQHEAEDKFARLQSLLDPRVAIGMLVINHFPDLTGYDLDSPVPELAMTSDQLDDGMKTSAREPEFTRALMARARQDKLTIRQLFDVISAGFWSLGVVGTPAKIADVMEEWFSTGAADGFIGSRRTCLDQARISSSWWCRSCSAEVCSVGNTKAVACANIWAFRMWRAATSGSLSRSTPDQEKRDA